MNIHNQEQNQGRKSGANATGSITYCSREEFLCGTKPRTSGSWTHVLILRKCFLGSFHCQNVPPGTQCSPASCDVSKWFPVLKAANSCRQNSGRSFSSRCLRSHLRLSRHLSGDAACYEKPLNPCGAASGAAPLLVLLGSGIFVTANVWCTGREGDGPASSTFILVSSRSAVLGGPSVPGLLHDKSLSLQQSLAGIPGSCRSITCSS